MSLLKSKILYWARMMAIVFVCFLLLIAANLYQINYHFQAVKFDKRAIVEKCTNPQVLAREIYADGGFQGIDYILNTGIVAVRGPVSQLFCFNKVGCLTAVTIKCPK